MKRILQGSLQGSEKAEYRAYCREVGFDEEHYANDNRDPQVAITPPLHRGFKQFGASIQKAKPSKVGAGVNGKARFFIPLQPKDFVFLAYKLTERVAFLIGATNE